MQNFLCAIGDSITAGQGATTPYTGLITVPGNNAIQNRGLSGQTLATISANTASYWPVGRSNNIAFLWAGSNDINGGTTPANTFTLLQSTVTSLHTLGYKVAVCTMLDRATISAANKNAYNALILANTASWEATVDFTATPLGIDGGSSNPTWFQDGIHPTQLGINTYEGPLIQAAINTLSLPIVAQTTFKFQQVFSNHNVTPVNITPTTYVSQNDAVLICGWWQGAQGLFQSITEATFGNTPNLLGTLLTAGSFSVGFWSIPRFNATGLPTIALNLSTPPGNRGLILAEWSAPDNTIAVINTSATATGSGGTVTSGSVTPLAHDLLAMIGFSGQFNFTVTPGAGYTSRLAGGPDATYVQDKLDASAGAQTASMTLSSTQAWANALFDFKTAPSNASGAQNDMLAVNRWCSRLWG